MSRQAWAALPASVELAELEASALTSSGEKNSGRLGSAHATLDVVRCREETHRGLFAPFDVGK